MMLLLDKFNSDKDNDDFEKFEIAVPNSSQLPDSDVGMQEPMFKYCNFEQYDTASDRSKQPATVSMQFCRSKLDKTKNLQQPADNAMQPRTPRW